MKFARPRLWLCFLPLMLLFQSGAAEVIITPEHHFERPQGLRPVALAEDASRLSAEPDSYEWWNFYAVDAGGDTSLSVIFFSANPWSEKYRKAVNDYQRDPVNRPGPVPKDHFMLHINLSKGARDIFSANIDPQDSHGGFSEAVPGGRIGQCSFNGVEKNGVKYFIIHLDALDKAKTKRIQADLEFHSLSPGFTMDGAGLFGRIPGGSKHQWQFPIGYPETEGAVKVTDRLGRKLYEHLLRGSGFCDHLFGQGRLSDILESWYFGRLDLGKNGALLYVWLTPLDKSVLPYGWVFRIPMGKTASLYRIASLVPDEKSKGRRGVPYYNDFSLTLPRDGQVRSVSPRLSLEESFQVSGPAKISVQIPDEPEVVDQPGFCAYSNFPLLESSRPGRIPFSESIPRFP